MANYRSSTRPRTVSQRQAIPGREHEMKENLAGGVSFIADPWTAFNRWLLIGSTGNCFYQNADVMTQENMDIAGSAIASDPERARNMIVDASQKALNLHTPILALALLGRKSKMEFGAAFPAVIRTASHLYEICGYAKDMRLMGRKHFHWAVKSWLQERDPGELEYQFLKYQGREGFTGRDVLRLIKPKTEDPVRNTLYKWIVGKGMNFEDSVFTKIVAFENMKKGTLENIAGVIRANRMTWEMIPGNVTMGQEIWEALFEMMPLGATLRNLGNLTDKQVLKKENTGYVGMLANRLSKEIMKKAHTHPMELIKALNFYTKGGEGGKSKLRWTPNGDVSYLVQKAVNDAFDVIEPTGKRTLQAVDVSGSMFGSPINPVGLEAGVIGMLMALCFLKSEAEVHTMGFHEKIVPVNLHKGTNFEQVLDKGSALWRGIQPAGTNAALPIEHAILNHIVVDAFVLWTDAQTWAGNYHVSEVLKQYRDRVNKNAKFIEVVLVPYSDKITLVDARMEGCYSIAGFNSDTPRLIQMLLKGDL